VAAEVVQRHAGGELVGALVEHHALAVDQAHHADHLLDLEAVRQVVVAHVAAGGELHLGVLQVEARLRELVEGADVVVVQVRDDHVAHLGGVDVEQAQGFPGLAQQHPLALLGHVGVETGVDDDGALGVAHHPDEVVHGHRRVVRIAADEVVRTTRFARRVLDREYLVFVV